MSRYRPLALIIVTVLVILLVPVTIPSVPRVLAISRSMTLVAFTQAWNYTSLNRNPMITVNPNEVISLKLIPGDLFFHRFHLDVDQSGTQPNCPPDKCSGLFTNPDTITYTFTVDFPAGRYKYYCSVHPLTMVGDFVVFIPSLALGGHGAVRI